MVRLDYTHYLAHQVLPPIERLCEPIEGTDRARLAECLGLDPSRYRSSSSSDGPELSFAALDSQLSDKDRFKDAAPLLIRCRHCTGTTHWAPIWDREVCRHILRHLTANCSFYDASLAVIYPDAGRAHVSFTFLFQAYWRSLAPSTAGVSDPQGHLAIL